MHFGQQKQQCQFTSTVAVSMRSMLGGTERNSRLSDWSLEKKKKTQRDKFKTFLLFLQTEGCNQVISKVPMTQVLNKRLFHIRANMIQTCQTVEF